MVDEYHACRRRAFNQNQRGFPLAIVRVADAADVQACLAFVQRQTGAAAAVKLCIISGGHSSKAMMTGAFVIDLCNMNKATVDVDKMTVTVEGAMLCVVQNVVRALES